MEAEPGSEDHDLDNLVNILMSKEELKETAEKSVGNKFSCHLCEYQAKNKITVKQHVEWEHNGVCYSCDHCNFKSKTNKNLRQHTRNMHGVNIFLCCDKCEYKSKYEGHLRAHKDFKHNGIYFSCKQCNYIGEELNRI